VEGRRASCSARGAIARERMRVDQLSDGKIIRDNEVILRATTLCESRPLLARQLRLDNFDFRRDRNSFL
jgi:hypothetical protein